MEHMSQPRKTDTLILAAAMEKLSRDIYCEDGVATAAIAEAAERLIELHGEVMSLRFELEHLRSSWRERK